ncbi:efflux RND transporter permease subunit [Rubellicoccus peritrichatus]|uniref:Efflux RND transporter permease subunit n=1 Tax=Rubellicoccus peritrichatus TaxID=3080537 RepID=A0AAQ3LAS5_9BACT|nr:efflux RND transporter permease subunit [Puniceicoccus sp. CR14]WOO41832.1 efflux RND transporter permease subunit [Puniceicoccus sp. CR14]
MINWFARNGVAANLLALVLIVGGFFAFTRVKIELFPQFSLDTITVTVPFRGAAPEEVEENINMRIEERIQDLEGIKELRSTAIEGSGTVSAEVEKGYDARKLLDDIKSRVDAIDTFPEEAEQPVIEEILIKREVLAISLFGDTDEDTLKRIAEEVRDDLLAFPNITQVEIIGVRDYEISVEVSEDALRRYGLTFDDVVMAIRNSSIDLPGGSIKSQGGEILLRTKGQAYRSKEFEAIVLLTEQDGTRVTVGDVATVVDGFTDNPLRLTTNGQPGVDLEISEVGSQNPLDISDTVKAYVAEKKLQLPDGISMTIWRDSSFYLLGRLNMLIDNAIIGLILVLVVLTLFLRPSLAFWVTLGIPISFLGTFLIMPWVGLSVNLISLFGFILVLGIVVDDAIVVGESVFTEFQKNGPSVESSIRGTHVVAVPVTFAVLTTAVAFTPLLMLPGFQGKFLVAIPLVVIPTLLFSLVESKLILPYHLSLCHVGDHKRDKINAFQRFQRKISDGLEWHVEHHFRPLLRLCLNNRYLTLSAFVSVLMFVISLIAGGFIKFMPFPPVPSDYIGVMLTYPDGTPETVTSRGMDQVVEALNEVIAEVEAAGRANPVEDVQTVLGVHAFGGGPGGTLGTSNQSHLGQVVLELRKSEDRENANDGAVELAKRWRELVGDIPGIKELEFNAEAAGGQGEPIDIQITGHSLEQLRIVANEIKDKLRGFDGVFDIRDNLADGQKEIKLEIKESAEALGLTQADLGRQVRQAFYGEEAQRIQRGRDDIRVMVRYPRDERESIGNLEAMRIRTPDGREVPFSAVAEANVGLGYAAINRENRQRIVNVYADADKDKIDLQAVKADLENNIIPDVLAEFPGVRAEFGGESKEVRESMISLGKSVTLVAFVMYALLAIPFKSYLQPFIVMAVIPFGLVGAVLGHVLLGHPISMLSLFGIIALSGVVVNDSLVLVDFINRKRSEGMQLLEAVWDSGANRFRPILLTSLTTFIGLSPILLETSLQAQFLIPMAISLSFGVLFATFITLILVPTIYLVLEDIKGLFVGGSNA